MNPYMRWGLRACVSVLVLVMGWIFRLELTGWFAPEWAARHTDESAAHEHAADGIAYWTCAMHPSVKANEAGPCPICGMDLQPVAAVAEVAAADETLTAPPTSQPTSQPTGQPTTQPSAPAPGFIHLTPWQRQLIGVTTAKVEERPLATTLRTVGRVDFDETRLADVNLKTRGWIEQLYVDFTGEHVERGQPLFTLYSPELVSTQDELLLAHSTLRSMEAHRVGTATAQEALVRQRSLVAASRRRLQLWDVTERQIERLLEEGESRRTVTVYAPAKGVVVDKMVVQGMYVTPGMQLYRIAALDTVWVQADVYEYEMADVRVGQRAVIELPNRPGQIHEGKVEFIYPYLDAKTRTTRVRLRVPNPDLALRPEMYANVTLQLEGGTHLAVPEEAVLRSGRRQIVFVDLGEGRLQPRQIRIGQRMANHYEVLAGLSEGELVATSAQFLLDSESKLKNVMVSMSAERE